MPFFGRTRELAALQAHLAAGRRLITLTGGPGFGKTRLARELLLRTRGEGNRYRPFPGGVVFCDLRAVSTLEQLCVTVARGCGLGNDERLGTAALLQRVSGVLEGRGRSLLVLDNLEHVVALARAPIAEWLARAPELTLITTSRERTGLRGEIVVPLGPLVDGDAASSAARFEPAVALFRFASRGAAGPATPSGLTEGTEVDADLLELISRLDANPLALELVADHARLLSPDELLTRLPRRVGAGTWGAGGRTLSLQPLWEAISQSWDALAQDEREALMQVAVFSGGARVKDLEAVVRGHGGSVETAEGGRALGLLEGLVEKSVLREDPRDSGVAWGRVSLYESIREFVLGKLAATPVIEARFRALHLELFARRAHGLARLDGVATTSQANEEVAEDASNFFEAIRFGLRAESSKETYRLAVEMLLRLSVLLAPLSSIDGLVRLFEEAASRHAALQPEAAVRLLRALATGRVRLGAPVEGREALEMAIAVAVEAQDEELEGLARSGYMSFVEWLDADVLMSELERALGQLRGERWRSIAAHTRGVLARLVGVKGDPVRSEALFEEAFDAMRDSLDLRTFAATLNNAAQITSLRADWPRVRALVTEALEAAKTARYRLLVSVLQGNLGECELVDGRFVAAETLFLESRATARFHGYHRQEGLSTGYLGWLALCRGEARAAVDGLDAALRQLSKAWDDPMMTGFFLACRALAEAEAGRPTRAAMSLGAARRRFDAKGDEALLAIHQVIGHAVAALDGELEVNAARHALALTSARVERAATMGHGLPVRHLVGFALRAAYSALERLDPRGAEPAPLVATGSVEDALTIRVISTGDLELLPSGRRLDMSRKPLGRRLMMALIAHHQAHPGEPVDLQTLFEAGWPREKIIEPHRSNRVYVAVARLRKQGLEDIIIHDGDGYLIAPEVVVDLDDWGG